MTSLRIPILLAASLQLTACGSNLAPDSLLANASDDDLAKSPCSGEHAGFYVCLAAQSSLTESAVHNTIRSALAALPGVVNSDQFATQVRSAFSNGDSILSTLTSTNYIVKIDSYCDEADNALAKATVGGTQIYYNECRMDDADTAMVSGVLMHEISHNLGFEHGETDPNRTSVPYYLGDLVEKDLGGAASGTWSEHGPGSYRRR